MKFGIFTIVPYHEDFTQQQALNDALEQIEYADQLGIEEVWLGEHRFSRHGLLSGIWSFLGAVAGRTKNIRIGTAVIVLPLHNPVLVAEEVAHARRDKRRPHQLRHRRGLPAPGV